MNIVCVICSDLLTPSDDVFHIPCGHIFHYTCLITWLKKSKTCPECRNRTTDDQIHRLCLSFSNNDSIEEDAKFLQSKNDSLMSQLTLKDRNLSNLTEVNEKLEKQTADLRREVQKLENQTADFRREVQKLENQTADFRREVQELENQTAVLRCEVESESNDKKRAIFTLKRDIKFYKSQYNLDINNYKKENEYLKNNLEHLKNVQSLIDTSYNNLTELVLKTNDASHLKAYIAVLKRKINDMTDWNDKVRVKFEELKEDYMRISTENKFLMEESTKRKELEERLRICETAKTFLQTQYLNMQKYNIIEKPVVVISDSEPET